MPSTYKQSLVMSPDSRLSVEVTRDESSSCWRVSVAGSELKIPANLAVDKRTAREFTFGLVSLLWPKSSAADHARKWQREAKRNRHNVV